MKIVIRKIFTFLFIFLCYSGWMTGLTFNFTECKMFPNYNMLTEAFIDHSVSIKDQPAVDYASLNGNRYLYSGPLPAILRFPFILTFGKSIPTGIMIAIFCTGISLLFANILEELTPVAQRETFVRVKNIFAITFIINGFSLLMVTIPSIHHEAICTAMFFLMMSLYFLVKIINNGYRISIRMSILMGLSLSMCIASRFSYFISTIFIGCVLLRGFQKNWHDIPKRNTLQALAVIMGFGAATMALLMWYNYLRFGDFFEFGIRYITSLYSDYFKQYGFFRFDHLPYNVWSMFFRIPTVIPTFPFIELPTYILKSQSFNLSPLFLINANELCTSVFCLLPITILSIAPVVSQKLLFKPGLRIIYLILLTVCFLQILPTALSVASVARYYYDFLPILLMLSYIGLISLKLNYQVSDKLTLALGILSVVLSLALPINGIRFYSQYIKYESPLLTFFF